MTGTTATTRRFEFVGDGSDKFWEIEVQDCEVIVRYGRNGTPGQMNSKTFASPGGAEKHAQKAIREKTGKGYIEVR